MPRGGNQTISQHFPISQGGQVVHDDYCRKGQPFRWGDGVRLHEDRCPGPLVGEMVSVAVPGDA